MAGQWVDVTGEVLEADVKQRKFQLWINWQTHVLVMFSDPQEVDVTTALRDHKSVRVRVKGQAEMSPQGKLLRVTEIEELVLGPVGEAPYDHSVPPIEGGIWCQVCPQLTTRASGKPQWSGRSEAPDEDASRKSR